MVKLASIRKHIYPNTGTVVYRLQWRNELDSQSTKAFKTESEAYAEAKKLNITIYKGKGTGKKSRTMIMPTIIKRLEIIEMRLDLLFELFEKQKHS